MVIDEEEQLWLVDHNDAAIGKGWQIRSSATPLKSFRVVNVFIRNSAGKIWIPRRSSTKRLFPDALDASTAGHVFFGETYYDCFKREIMEEVRLSVDSVPWHFLGKLSPYEHPISAWMEIYEIHYNEVPPYNASDFSEYYWLTEEEFFERLEFGDRARGDIPYLLRWCYQLRKGQQ